MMKNRRRLLQSSLLACTPLALPSLAQTSPPEKTQLALASGRKLDLTVAQPAGESPRAVLLFSHALGGAPEAYGLLQSSLLAAGYALLLPLHIDAKRNPLSASTPLQATFAERLAELHACVDFAAQRWPQLPLAAVGHSYGSLFAWALGGALDEVGPLRRPELRAVLAFSSPGVLPMQQRERSYRSLAVPSFTVTGTADRVPGFVDDWQEHLLAHRQSPKPSWALVLQEGGHFLPIEPKSLALVLPLALDFLAAQLLRDGPALERLHRFGNEVAGLTLLRNAEAS